MPARSIPKDAAYQIINDELMLDGAPRLNLASFVTTWMEPECDKLIMASLGKNCVEMYAYPATTELQIYLYCHSMSLYGFERKKCFLHHFLIIFLVISFVNFCL